MDTHIRGQAASGNGAIAGLRGKRFAFGAAATVTLLLQTVGATPAAPLLVEFIGAQTTAFDGTSHVTKINSTLLDGTGAADHLTDPTTTSRLVLVADRKFYATFDPTNSTTGDVTLAIRIAGLGTLA